MENPIEETYHHSKNHLGFSSVELRLDASAGSLILFQGFVPTGFGLSFLNCHFSVSLLVRGHRF